MSNSRRIFKWLFAAGFALILLALGLKLWRIYSAVQSLQSRKLEAELLMAAGPASVDLDSAESLVFGLREDVVTLKNETALFMPIAPLLTWLPKVGPLMAEAPNLIELADAGSDAAVFGFAGLKPAAARFTGGGDSNLELLPEMVGILEQAQPALGQVAIDIDRIEAAAAQIEDWESLPWSIRQMQQPLNDYIPLAKSGLELSSVLPELMGANGQKTYLIIAQNEDERRATGGFISGVGTLVIENGNIISLDFRDSYTVDDFLNRAYEYPPQPLQRFLGIDMFGFRDANFWPDFPTSAEKMRQLFLYNEPYHGQIDGVIAIDQTFLGLLLEGLGPVYIAEMDISVHSGNVNDIMRASWGNDGSSSSTQEWWKNRKAIMGWIVNAMQNKLFNQPGDIDAQALLNAIMTAGEEHHLQIYLDNPQARIAIQKLGWDGSIPYSGNHDILMAVDTNLGYNKVNALIQRRLNYQLTINSDGSAVANLTASYQHTGPRTLPECSHTIYYDSDVQYDELINNCYWNYLRIYTPPNSLLLSASEHPAPGKWFVTQQPWDGSAGTIEDPSGLTVFDNFMVVKQASKLQAQFEYALPNGIIQSLPNGDNLYQLTVTKQAGSPSERVRVILTLPAGTSLVSSTPQNVKQSGNTLTFEWLNATDTTIEVVFR